MRSRKSDAHSNNQNSQWELQGASQLPTNKRRLANSAISDNHKLHSFCASPELKSVKPRIWGRYNDQRKVAPKERRPHDWCAGPFQEGMAAGTQ
jgi:hypothetical protein